MGAPYSLWDHRGSQAEVTKGHLAKALNTCRSKIHISLSPRGTKRAWMALLQPQVQGSASKGYQGSP